MTAHGGLAILADPHPNLCTGPPPRQLTIPPTLQAGRLKTGAPDVNIGFQNKLPFPFGQVAEAIAVLRELPK